MERDEVYEGYEYDEINFNSHAHVERDNIDTVRERNKPNFNSHAHVERDEFNQPYF